MKEKYVDLVKQNKWDELSKIISTNDLIDYEVEGKLLIEYLLEQGVHSSQMDNCVQYNTTFAFYYLKYNIVEPVMNGFIGTLLSYYQDKRIIELLLDKLDDKNKMLLLHNIKVQNYNEYYQYEDELVSIYLKHGIVLPTLFVKKDFHVKEEMLDDEDKKVLDEFKALFYDGKNARVLQAIVDNLQRRLKSNHQRTMNDINKLIALKKKNSRFALREAKINDEAYDWITKAIKINPNNPSVFEHEISHVMYSDIEGDEESILAEYEELRKQIDLTKRDKMIKYLLDFHKEYDKTKNLIRHQYYEMIEEKYGSLDNYINAVCQDMLKNKPEMLEINNTLKGERHVIFNIKDIQINDIVMEFLLIKEGEYIQSELNRIFSEELMLENMLDALLLGEICDGKLFITSFEKQDDGTIKKVKCPMICLSGHECLYFLEIPNRSLDECLANYDAIRKSDKKDKLCNVLKEIVGNDLLVFLNNYIEKNREVAYGH